MPRHQFDRQSNRLPWPVQGGTVVRTFGVHHDPRYGTGVKNQGIDIACRQGTPVFPVGAGRVSFADHFRGYGKMVIVEHGAGFYSVYSRLTEIQTMVGRNVEPRDTLGLASDTLHFEMRVGGKPVDPLFWLSPPHRTP